MTAETSYCDTPEKPFAFENQYTSASLKAFSSRDKLQIRGGWQKNPQAIFFLDLDSAVQ